MIPILYKSDETDFSTHGMGMLSDATECTASEQINDAYELSLSYPVDGIHFGDIEYGCLIKALVSDGTEQLFRVYDIDADYPDCTISAEHISYQANGIIVRPFTASTAAETMAALKSSSMNSNPFIFNCSLNASGYFSCDVPASVKSQLEETLKVYGGELYYDNYSISLMEQRGQKRNVTLRYGKNIVSIKQDQNIEETYSGAVGYWKGHVNEVDQTVTGNIISTGSPIPHERILVVDVSSEIETEDNTAATVSQVDAAVQEYIDKNKPGIPKISLEIDMAALWQTEEYKDLAPIEKVTLGDTVTVIFDKLGISEDTRAVKIEWDVLNERNSSVTFGEVERTYADDMEDQQQAAADAQDSADAANDNANEVRDALNKNVSSINLNIGTIEEEQKGMKASIAANAQGIQTQVTKTETMAQTINSQGETISQQGKTITDQGTALGNQQNQLNDQKNELAEQQTVISRHESTLTQQADLIQAQVTRIDTIAGEQQTMQSTITQQANQINARVQKGSIISEINQSAEGITIDADKITLAGNTTFVSLQNDVTNAQSTADSAATAAGNAKSAADTAKSAADIAQSTANGKLSADDLGVHGTTSIDGGRIKTGTIDAARIDTSKIFVHGVYDDKTGLALLTASDGIVGVGGSYFSVSSKNVSFFGDIGFNASNINLNTAKVNLSGAKISGVSHGDGTEKFLRIKDGEIYYTDSAVVK